MTHDQIDADACIRQRALIERTGREPLEAYLFLREGQRVSDLLNDRRQFLPAAAMDGRFLMIAKNTIEEIEPREDGADYDDEDEEPHIVLGVDEDAPLRDVVEAYKLRLKRLHPDAVRAAGLDHELVLIADGLTKQLNAAYQAIRRRRVGEERFHRSVR